MRPLLLTNAALPERAGQFDLLLAAGRIARITPAGLAERSDSLQIRDLGGRCLSPGLADSHVHLDKAGILERCPICEGTLAEAVRLTAAAKAGFTEEDVYHRAVQVLREAIGHGTQYMRSFAETDPRTELRGFHALRRLKRDYAPAIELQICAFAQEGLTQEMATYALLERACAEGADLVGGCPYTDPDPAAHIELIFDLAARYDLDVDFHLDFDLNPAASNIGAVIAATERRGWGGRVSIGHVTQLSARPAAEMMAIGARLSEAGIALTVLPATDLFLMGRTSDHLQPRGVTPAHRLPGLRSSLATNNVLNPFTPLGDAALIRMANLYANIAQVGDSAGISRIYSMICADAGRILGRELAITEGAPADLILLDAPDPVSAIRANRPVLCGWKAGLQTFERPPVQLFSDKGTAV